MNQICVQDNLMWDIWLSMYQLPTLTVADEIGLFTCILESYADIRTLSNKLCISEKATNALINVLVGLKFIIKENNKLSLAPVSRLYLIPESPFYWGAQIKGLYNRPEHLRLIEAIRSSTNTLSYDGKTFTEMWENDSLTIEAAKDFTDKMHATIYAPAVAAIKGEHFKSTTNLLDVGGGSGCFLIAFVEAYPERTGTVFELPPVCEVAKQYIQGFNLTNKISVSAGNFFDNNWPKNHDGILFSQIFHDWSREVCEDLAKKAYDALPLGGKIYIHEMVLNDDHSSPLTTACFNLLMYINHGSQQFSKSEIFTILTSAGFKNPVIEKTHGYHSLIIATKEV